MENSTFDFEILKQIQELLSAISKANLNNVVLSEKINNLISCIDSYKSKNISIYPEMLKELNSYYQTLQLIPVHEAKNISQKYQSICKSCFFHDDSCFVNIGYLIFKSVELRNYIEPNKIRPILRIF